MPKLRLIRSTMTAAAGLAMAISCCAANAAGDFAEGTFYQVAGVKTGDALNLRSKPDPNAAVVARIKIATQGLVSTGRSTERDGAVWAEIKTSTGSTGWVNSIYLKRTAGKSRDCEGITVTSERLRCFVDRVTPPNRKVTAIISGEEYLKESDERTVVDCTGTTCHIDLTLETNRGASGVTKQRYTCRQMGGSIQCSKEGLATEDSDASPPEAIDPRTGRVLSR